MIRTCCVAVGLVAMLSVTGCGAKAPPGIQRDPVSKVVGKVLIDGEPQPQVSVRLSRVSGPDTTAGTSQALTPNGFTDKDGKFSLGTYELGAKADGAPKGEYVLLIKWGSVELMSGQYVGDKLNGKYNDPKKSDIKVTVEGKPVDLGTVEVKTK